MRVTAMHTPKHATYPKYHAVHIAGMAINVKKVTTFFHCLG